MPKIMGVLVLPELELKVLRNLIREKLGAGVMYSEVLDYEDEEPAYFEILERIETRIEKEIKHVVSQAELPPPSNIDEIPF